MRGSRDRSKIEPILIFTKYVKLHKIFFFIRITTDRFLEVSRELVEIFKKPDNFIQAEDFYWPADGKKNAGGPLYCRYTKFRRQLLQEKIIRKHDMTLAGINLNDNIYLDHVKIFYYVSRKSIF